MNNKRSEREAELIADLFHEDWAEGKMAGYARRAAAGTRRRRILKNSLAATALVALCALFLYPLVRQRSSPPEGKTSARFIPLQRDFEIISTEELLSQLRDRPLLVIDEGQNQKRVILLGQN